MFMENVFCGNSLSLIWCGMCWDGIEQRGAWHETEHGCLWVLVGMDLNPVASVTVLLFCVLLPFDGVGRDVPKGFASVKPKATCAGHFPRHVQSFPATVCCESGHVLCQEHATQSCCETRVRTEGTTVGLCVDKPRHNLSWVVGQMHCFVRHIYDDPDLPIPCSAGL